MLAIGAALPSVELQDDKGQPVNLASLAGQPVVFFFYPKASTPGCTKEACEFRDLSAAFEAAGAKVFGVSADSVKRQANFASKYELTMPLLSDEAHQILEPWGVWAEKKNYGKTYMGIVRSTFLFGRDGTLAEVWSPVKVAGHADAVLKAVNAL